MKFLRILAILAILAAAIGGAAYYWREEMVNWWLQRKLAGELSRQLDAKVELDSVRYHDGVLRAGLFRVAGERMPFALLEIREASVPVDLKRLEAAGREPVRIEAAVVSLVWRDQGGGRQGNAPGLGGGTGADPWDAATNDVPLSSQREERALASGGGWPRRPSRG